MGVSEIGFIGTPLKLQTNKIQGYPVSRQTQARGNRTQADERLNMFEKAWMKPKRQLMCNVKLLVLSVLQPLKKERHRKANLLW